MRITYPFKRYFITSQSGANVCVIYAPNVARVVRILSKRFRKGLLSLTYLNIHDKNKTKIAVILDISKV